MPPKRRKGVKKRTTLSLSNKPRRRPTKKRRR